MFRALYRAGGATGRPLCAASGGNRAEAKAIYNVLENEKFDRDEIARKHRKETVKRMADETVIL
jgi:hypothetical protein